MGVPTKLLTVVTLLNHVLSILLHSGPVISQCEGPTGERSGAHMVSIDALVDFPEHIVSLLWGQAPKEWLGK